MQCLTFVRRRTIPWPIELDSPFTYTIFEVGIQQMPRKDQDTPFDISGLVGGMFYTFILHMLLPVFTAVRQLSVRRNDASIPTYTALDEQTIVQEKEKRIREMMKMVCTKSLCPLELLSLKRF